MVAMPMGIEDRNGRKLQSLHAGEDFFRFQPWINHRTLAISVPVEDVRILLEGGGNKGSYLNLRNVHRKCPPQKSMNALICSDYDNHGMAEAPEA
jgi:hypothetical protein